MTILSALGKRRIKHTLGCNGQCIHACRMLGTIVAAIPRCKLSRVPKGYNFGLVLGSYEPSGLVKGVFSPRCNFARFVSRESPKRNYYDILGITPKATQAQVKQAYYKMSKTYHPDQNKGQADAALKFREVSEAYEILGSFQKRRMYDKGILNYGVAATHQEAEQYSSKFYESRRKRGKVPVDGRTPIYNFDEWSKSHYSDTFVRKQRGKYKYEEFKEKIRVDHETAKTEKLIYIILLIGGAVIFNMSLTTDADKPKTSSKYT